MSPLGRGRVEHPLMQTVCILTRPGYRAVSFCAECNMGREINVNSTDRLDMQDAARLTPDALRLLEDAYDARLQQVGGHGVMLDSMVEIAAEMGYTGTMDDAASLLRAAGYRVQEGPSGRLIALK